MVSFRIHEANTIQALPSCWLDNKMHVFGLTIVWQDRDAVTGTPRNEVLVLCNMPFRGK